MEYTMTTHARDMLLERKIKDEWVKRVVDDPDWENKTNDGTVHYFKKIPEYESRVLHVILNPSSSPHRVITAFFDRKARRQHATQSR